MISLLNSPILWSLTTKRLCIRAVRVSVSFGGDNRKKAAGYEWIYEHGYGEGEIMSGDLFGCYLDSPFPPSSRRAWL